MSTIQEEAKKYADEAIRTLTRYLSYGPIVCRIDAARTILQLSGDLPLEKSPEPVKLDLPEEVLNVLDGMYMRMR